MGWLDGDLATLLADSIDFLMLDATLRRETSTTLDSKGDEASTTPTTFACRAFDDDYSAIYRARAGIPATDTRICIMAASLAATPTQDDKIQFRSGWYQIRKVMTDPARGVWECQCYAIAEPT